HRDVLDGPDRIGDGSPQPKQNCQKEARNEYIGAPLYGRRDEPGPPAFKALPRHHTVLNGKQAQQNPIDDQRLWPCPLNAGIDRLWRQISNEEYSIDARRRGDEGCREPVKQSKPWHALLAVC